MITRLSSFLVSQKGAMFGLDARLSVAVLGILSVMAGSYYFSNYHSTRSKALSEEFRHIGMAIDGYQYDMKEDLINTITTPDGSNELTSLYDDSVIQAAFQARWNGPYLDHDTPGKLYNAPLSAITLVKGSDKSTGSGCTVITQCYYWLRLQPIRQAAAEHLNDIFDGGNETTPEDEGIVRWNIHGDPGMVDLWYAAAQAFSL